MFKKTIIFAGLIVLSIEMFAQAPFEGLIKMKEENKTFSETSDIDIYLKNGNARMDINLKTKEYSSILNMYFPKNGEIKMTADVASKKMVYDIPYSSFANSEFSSAFSSEITGQKATYAGYECEEVVVRTQNSLISCWVSKATGIGPSSFPSIILGKGAFSALQKNNIQGIPLKITIKDFAGNVISDQEIVSIQIQSVPDHNFVVPSEYTTAK